MVCRLNSLSFWHSRFTSVLILIFGTSIFSSTLQFARMFDAFSLIRLSIANTPVELWPTVHSPYANTINIYFTIGYLIAITIISWMKRGPGEKHFLVLSTLSIIDNMHVLTLLCHQLRTEIYRETLLCCMTDVQCDLVVVKTRDQLIKGSFLQWQRKVVSFLFWSK